MERQFVKIDDASNVYRIEVQCEASKRFDIMKAYSLPSVHRRIQETACRRPKKERIYNWLRLIAQTGSFAESSHCLLRGVYLDDEPQTWVQGSKRTLADYIESCRHEARRAGFPKQEEIIITTTGKL